MRIQTRTALLVASAGALALGLGGTATFAQGGSETSFDEIIVTARKRDETSLSVPVVLSAVTGTELTRRGVTSVAALGRIVPQLMISEGPQTNQGGSIIIRGIGAGESNPFVDQTVSFNIDGVQNAKGAGRRAALMDIAQVEVLKGPQALYFGKNSPAGIISIRTADPTPTLEAKISVGYEFYGREKTVDGYVAGPITDKLGGRVAFSVSHLDGWVTNTASQATTFSPANTRVPKAKEYAIRGTLKYESADTKFDARLKYFFNSRRGTGAGYNFQIVHCAGARPQFGPSTDCTADNKISKGDVADSFLPFTARFADGVPYYNGSQSLLSLQMNYHLSDALTLTSVSGYFNSKYTGLENFTGDDAATLLPSAQLGFYNNDWSQEVRLTSDFKGPLNFMVGGHYQDITGRNGSITYINANAPTFLNQFFLEQRGQAWSIFAQGMWDILPTLEFSGGARYSHEKKNLPVVRGGVGLTNVATPVTDGSWNNVSPEATLTWRPSDRLTVFGSYKYGFLSGGFNSGNSGFGSSLKYNQQVTRGAEAGIKALWLNGRLRTNLSVYDYVTTGLQVTSTIQTIQVVTNAGKVYTKGVEFDFAYLVPNVDGLSFRGAAAYNHGQYGIFSIGCYRGQTRSLGCNFGSPNAATGNFSLQDLAGQRLFHAPLWVGSVGANYETPINARLKIGLSADANFTSGYFTDPSNTPAARMEGYALLDATATLGDQNDRWEIAVVGRNLTNKYYWTNSNDYTNGGTVAGGVTGTIADTLAMVSRGREVMLRLTFKMGS